MTDSSASDQLSTGLTYYTGVVDFAFAYAVGTIAALPGGVLPASLLVILNAEADLKLAQTSGAIDGNRANELAAGYAGMVAAAVASAALAEVAIPAAAAAALVGGLSVLVNGQVKAYLDDNNIDVGHVALSGLQDLDQFLEATFNEVEVSVNNFGDSIGDEFENSAAAAANFLDEIAFRMLSNPILDNYSPDVRALADTVRDLGSALDTYFDDLWGALTGSGSGGSSGGVPGGFGPNDPGGNRAMVSG